MIIRKLSKIDGKHFKKLFIHEILLFLLTKQLSSTFSLVSQCRVGFQQISCVLCFAARKLTSERISIYERKFPENSDWLLHNSSESFFDHLPTLNSWKSSWNFHERENDCALMENSSHMRKLLFLERILSLVRSNSSRKFLIHRGYVCQKRERNFTNHAERNHQFVSVGKFSVLIPRFCFVLSIASNSLSATWREFKPNSHIGYCCRAFQKFISLGFFLWIIFERQKV